jgi:hypothetical protein
MAQAKGKGGPPPPLIVPAGDGWVTREHVYTSLPETVYLAVALPHGGTVELVHRDFRESSLFEVFSQFPEADSDQNRARFWSQNGAVSETQLSERAGDTNAHINGVDQQSFGDLTLLCGVEDSVQTADISYVLGGNPPPPQLLRDGLQFYTDSSGSLDVNEFNDYLIGVKRTFPSLIGAENCEDVSKKQNSLLHHLIDMGHGNPAQVDALNNVLQMYEEDPIHLATMLCSTNADDCTPLRLACDKKNDPMITAIVNAVCSALGELKVQPLKDEEVKMNIGTSAEKENFDIHRVVYTSKPLIRRLLRLEDLL